MKKIIKLIDVKSIVTLSLTALFFILSIKGMIEAEKVVTIYTTIIAFYFGTQYQKNEKDITDNKDDELK